MRQKPFHLTPPKAEDFYAKEVYGGTRIDVCPACHALVANVVNHIKWHREISKAAYLAWVGARQ
jgi:hypothetical protein